MKHMTRITSDDRRRMAKGEAVTTVKTRKQGNVTVRTTVTKKKGETDVDTLYTGVAFRDPSTPRKTVKKASDKPKKKAVAKKAVATERAVYGPVNRPEMRGSGVYVTPKIPSIANLDNLSRPALDRIAKEIHNYAFEKIKKQKRGSWRFGYYYVALWYSDAGDLRYSSIGLWRLYIRKARDSVTAAESMSFEDAQKVYKWTNNERRIVYAAAAKLDPPTREEIDAERDGHRIRLQLYEKLMKDTDGIPFRSRSGQITWKARNLLVEADTGIDSSPRAREFRQANVKKAADLLKKSREVLKNENWAPVRNGFGLSKDNARLMFKNTLKNRPQSGSSLDGSARELMGDAMIRKYVQKKGRKGRV